MRACVRARAWACHEGPAAACVHFAHPGDRDPVRPGQKPCTKEASTACDLRKEIGDSVRTAIKNTGGRYPLWFVPQAFGNQEGPMPGPTSQLGDDWLLHLKPFLQTAHAVVAR